MISKGRVVVVVLLALLVSCVALVWWVRSRPPFTAEEMAAAEDTIGALRADLRQTRCHRPSVGQAPGTARTSVAELLDPAGPQAACLQLAGEEQVADALLSGRVSSPDGSTRRWAFDVPNTAPIPAAPLGVAFVSSQHPPFPDSEVPTVYQRVQDACAELPATIAQLAAEEDHCSPYSPWAPGWLDTRIEAVSLARAIAVMARKTARDGELEEALLALVNGVAVLQDLRRGPTNLVVAMLSIASETILWSTFNSLLMPSPGPSTETGARLARSFDALLRGAPHPHDVFAAELVEMLDTTNAQLAGSEESGLAVVVAAEQARWLEETCPREREASECFADLPSTPPARSVFVEGWELIAGPNATVRGQLLHMAYDISELWRRYYARLLSSRVAMQILRVMLALSEQRERGICPTDAELDPRLLSLPFASGPIEITHLRGVEYEVTAPSLPVMPNFERLVLYSLCPAPRGGWAQP